MTALVAIRRCDGYDRILVQEAVNAVLEALGGISPFVRPGQKVLLKPNMLSAKAPEQAVTTHPMVVEAVTRRVLEAGGEVWIGDSPSAVHRGLQRYWEATGYLDVAKRTGAKLVNFEAGGTVGREVEGRIYYVAKKVFEADLVINLPKLKTHGLVMYTGAIKNLYGCLPGFQKARYHKTHPHPDRFSDLLVDVYACIRPALTLMDGIVGMEGNGPSTGKIRKAGVILASTDGVALDAVVNDVMGFQEGEVPTTRIAGERGLGEFRLDRIRIDGPSLESLRIPDFQLPPTHLLQWIPSSLVRFVGRFLWVRPKTDPERCTGCGVCARLCPVQAIRMEHTLPVTDYRLCINCMCCNESCPEGAITQETSQLARLFS